jgi:acyl-CoA synthetase (AMP-forming)/AMP-acid ligase II
MPGELRVRGYSLMRGMYKATRDDTFDASGFYATGDICRLDADGFLYFDGRLGEMIKSSGANVSPREVELVLESWPQVREAVVIGVPDDRRGEAIAAVVVLRDGDLDREALHTFLRSQLSHFKVPQYLMTMAYENVPRAAAGKVQKHALRDIVVASADGLTPLAG